MKINKHGLTINNLKAASGATGVSSQLHTQLSYNRETGDICIASDLIGNNFVVYDDPAIIFITDTYCHLTMQEISDRIYDAVTVHNTLG